MPVAIIVLFCGVGFLVMIVLLMFTDQPSLVIWSFAIVCALALISAFFGLAWQILKKPKK